MVIPSRFFLLNRLQDAFESRSQEDRQAIEEVFGATGLGSLLDLRTTRRIERRDNQEVWGEVV